MKRANRLIQLIGLGVLCASLLILNSVIEWNLSEIIEVINQLF